MSSNPKSPESENKRRRLTQACELCRRKKIKCDGGKPTCGNCVRLNNTCIYSSSNKKRGPRQGYIEMLEQRLAKMEQILLPETVERLNEEGELTLPIEEDKEPPVEEPPKPIKTKRRSTEDHDNTNSPTSFSSISSNFPSPPTHIIGQQKVDYSQEFLPPLNVIEHMVDLFFKYLYTTIPIFDEATLRNDIRERKCPDFLILCLLAACARFSDRPDIKENPAWHAGESYAEKARSLIVKVVDEPTIPNTQGLLLLSVHEYGCGRGPRSWMYTGILIRMAMELGLHEDTEDTVSFKSDQAKERLIQLEVRRGLFWSIFALDKFSSAATGRPSSLQEQFCTTFLPARIEETHDGQYYTENLCGDRFTMLNVNGLMDTQLIGAGSGSDTSMLENRPYLNSFAYFTRATNLLSKVTSYVNLKRKEKHDHLLPCHPDSEFYKINQAIDELEHQLPPHMKNTPENRDSYSKSGNKSNFVFFHILYNTVIVLLHRPSLVIAESIENEAVHPDLKKFVCVSVKKCMDAVNNVTIFLKEIGRNKELMPPFLTYLAYTVATVVVNESFSPRQEEAQKAKQALGVYFQLLLAARNLWAMADKLYFMVRDLYAIHTNVLRRQLESKKNVEQPSFQSTNFGTNQYGFDLLQQSPSFQQAFPSYQPPSNSQQFQLQHVTTLDNNSSSINNSMIDWSLSYYHAAMSYEAPNSTVLPSNFEDLSILFPNASSSDHMT